MGVLAGGPGGIILSEDWGLHCHASITFLDPPLVISKQIKAK